MNNKLVLPTKSSVIYIHNQAPSLLSKIIGFVMRMINMKSKVEKLLAKRLLPPEADLVPKSFLKKADIILEEVDGFNVWIVKPKNSNPKKKIVYLHGSAYVLNITKHHWNFAEQIFDANDATIIIPEYPLAPRFKVKRVYSYLINTYDKYLSDVKSEDLVFLGDSSGAALALGLAQKLKVNKKTVPGDLILVSPWLDITLNNPEVIEVDKKDKVLGLRGLKTAGIAFSNSVDMHDPMLSPINGDLDGVGHISLFIGTEDILYPDTKRMKKLLEEKNISFNYFEYPEMFHGWIMTKQLEEAQNAYAHINDIIKNG